MAIMLGIDTGGTYTDAVLFDEAAGVLRSAKALTTKYDLSVGIREAVEAVLPDPAPDIRMVSLSTTLATNALVEGQGSPICLALLGYPQDVLDQEGLRKALGAHPVVFVEGGHTVSGEEQMPLDLDALREAVRTYAPQVAAFAVSGYFAVRNPEHELAARACIREMSGLPVTCGHELTSSLHAPRRALTTALNARLIPLLQQLILAMRALLEEKRIRAPLMVVKGDGSLVDAQVALERPVETILSGPAASVVGARHLSGEDDVFVVDMGGTTTDIALLRDGRPVLSSEGATVGGWRTMVEAVAVHTFGLGGDSEVRVDDRGGITVGPRRVVPLSLLSSQHPAVVDALRRQLAAEEPGPNDGRFVVRQRPLDAGRASLSESQAAVWELLAGGPVAVADLMASAPLPLFRELALAELAERGLVVLSGFTPTDAAHVVGAQRHWSLEAARLGARRGGRRGPGAAPDGEDAAGEFAGRVMARTMVQAGRAVVMTALAESNRGDGFHHEAVHRHFVDPAVSGTDNDALVHVALTLRRPLVAVGAPVGTFYPPLADRLNTRLCIPEHAGIANAVGAVAGGVMQTVRALVKPLPLEQGYRVHLPTGMRDFTDLEEAAGCALAEVSRLAEAQARRAGAVDVHVEARRGDHIVRDAGKEVFFETEVTATAVGRPRLAEG